MNPASTATALSVPRGLVLRDLRGGRALRALMSGDAAERTAARDALAPLVQVLQGRWAVAAARSRELRPTAIDPDAAWADFQYAEALHQALSETVGPAGEASDPAADFEWSSDCDWGTGVPAPSEALDDLDGLMEIMELAEPLAAVEPAVAVPAVAEPAAVVPVAAVPQPVALLRPVPQPVAVEPAVPQVAVPQVAVPVPHPRATDIPDVAAVETPAADQDEQAPAPAPRTRLTLVVPAVAPGFVPSGPDE